MLFDNDSFKNYDMLDLSFFNIQTDKLNEMPKRLYDKKEGFLKGNMFKNEFDPYRNYEVQKIIPKNRTEEVELKLYELDFAINDLNLYLDIHPDDHEIYHLFKKYIKEYDEVKREYDKMVGPLCLTDVTSSSYNWLEEWPWEGEIR